MVARTRRRSQSNSTESLADSEGYDSSSSPRKSGSASGSKPSSFKNPSWGRSSGIGLGTKIGSACILLFCPLMVIYFWLVCDAYQCSLYEPVRRLLAAKGGLTKQSLYAVFGQYLPRPTVVGSQIFVGWLVFQGLLYAWLPAKIGYGQRTPAGHMLPYKVNGLLAWVVTHLLFVVASFHYGWFAPTVVHDHWGALLVAANVYGYSLTVFAYAKAHWFPTHAEDRKFSGSWIYDFFMGIEVSWVCWCLVSGVLVQAGSGRTL